MIKTRRERKPLTASKYLALGYFSIILIGTFLLCTPFSKAGWNFDFSSKGFWGNWTNPITSMFTATSAACVTGLITVDTPTYWSLFGQVIILILIQLGGLGFVSVISLLVLIFKRKMNTKQRKIAVQASGMFEIGDVNKIIKRVIVYTIIFETIGSLLLMIRFIPKFGIGYGMYYSIFTSISAFCNAGFALFSDSLEQFAKDPLVLIVVMGLILSGGLGFVVWENIFKVLSTLFKKNTERERVRLHTKLVLVASIIVVILPALIFFLIEFNNPEFDSMNVGEKLLNSFFLSITCRTAGFNTFDYSKLSDSSMMICNVLMLIGGCSGSTAGGVKLTTFVILVLAIVSAARRSGIEVGKRRIDDSYSRQAAAILVFYLFLLNVAIITISILEHNFGSGSYSFRDIMFEVISAIATVGLSTSGTANLCIYSQIVIIALMYIGRNGALTIIYIFAEKNAASEGVLKRPEEKVLIG